MYHYQCETRSRKNIYSAYLKVLSTSNEREYVVFSPALVFLFRDLRNMTKQKIPDGMMEKPRVIVIGGGGTGAAILLDLSLRGLNATLLERGELTSGTTGRHHGQLHSGARYAVGDTYVAAECMEESRILTKIANDGIERNYGLFVALSADDEHYADIFTKSCEEAGIPVYLLSRKQALLYEPYLNPGLRFAIQVPDGSMDAWRVPLQFFAGAKQHGASLRTFHEVVGIDVSRGAVRGVRVRDWKQDRDYTLGCDVVINAAGVWAGKVGSLAGVKIPVLPSPGTMIAVEGRLTNMVISRLRPPGDGDAIIPQRNLSIVGTTGLIASNPDAVSYSMEEVTFLLSEADKLIPGYSKRPIHSVWSAARPLIGDSKSKDSRTLSRDFLCMDHKARDNIDGLISVIGGKATTLRAMGESAVNLACKNLGISVPCKTRECVLPSYRQFFRETQ